MVDAQPATHREALVNGASAPPKRARSEVAMLHVPFAAYRSGTWRNVMINVWSAQATGAAVTHLSRLTHALHSPLSERWSFIHLIREGAGLPTIEASKAFVQVMKQHEQKLAIVAVMIGGTGFWASTMRSAITSMRFISPRSFEMRLHGSAAEIAAWVPEAHRVRTGVTLRPHELLDVLTDAYEWTEATG